MFYEKLYFNKEIDLFIDEERTTKLLQHQKDGLRFLYEQYQKNSPGAILNDLPGSGAKVQIVVYLNVIQLLQQPILVLSDNVQYYEELFNRWTNGADGVICNSKKLVSGKQIYLNDFTDVVSLSVINWSVLVVHNEECSDKLMKQLNGFKAGFKIVVISADLKKDIAKFFRIYQWINPNNKTFSAKDFVSRKQTNIKDRIEQAILLDCFFETIVLRRTNIGGIFTKEEASRGIVDPPQTKNKDKTGTKIKRTRQKTKNENCDSNATNEDHTERKNKIARKSREHNVDNTLDESIFDRETFVKNSLPKKSKRLRIVETDSDEEISVIQTTTVIEVCDVEKTHTNASIAITECHNSKDAKDNNISISIVQLKNKKVAEKKHCNAGETGEKPFMPENNEVDTATEHISEVNKEVVSSQECIEASQVMFTDCDMLRNQTNDELTNGENVTKVKENEVDKSCNEINIENVEEKAFRKYKGSIFDNIF